ncbi:MAG: T9SS type A sorting domain-containing protein, partial [Bacteroidota bacterium]
QYQLDAGQQQLLSYPVDGWGMRLETQQTLGHPVGEMISMVVPNCSDDAIGNALFTLLPLSDGDPYLETFCAPVVGPFDPNAKSAVPVGLGEIHGIDTDWELHYTLQFQNTGTDTAIQVILRDTLSENLDLSTISVGGSSHAFSWALNPDRELVFTFDDIYLPDSNVNLAASEGFVEFSIFPKADLLPGEQIFNDVAIYFDFNDPVITNTVFHTIRKPVHASSEQAPWCAGDEYDGMVIEQDTSIQIYTDLVTHDSIHFVHLDVLPVSQEMIAMEVNSGATVAGVLITADTSFTQSFPNQYGCDSLINYDISVLTSTNNIELWSRDIEVFPNPVHEVLHIVHHESGQFQEWSLSNNLGVQVWQKQLFPYETLTGVSLFPFPPGIYLLEVKTAEGTASWKILHL